MTGRAFFVSCSTQTSRIHSLLVEPVGNRWRLPIGGFLNNVTTKTRPFLLREHWLVRSYSYIGCKWFRSKLFEKDLRDFQLIISAIQLPCNRNYNMHHDKKPQHIWSQVFHSALRYQSWNILVRTHSLTNINKAHTEVWGQDTLTKPLNNKSQKLLLAFPVAIYWSKESSLPSQLSDKRWHNLPSLFSLPSKRTASLAEGNTPRYLRTRSSCFDTQQDGNMNSSGS